MMKVGHKEMVGKICRYQPCCGRAAVESWMAAAPKLVSARDVVRLSAGVVPDRDRLWVAFRLAPKPVVAFVARRAVMRAVGYAAAALDRANTPHDLRALTATTDYSEIKLRCRDAADAARAADAAAARAAATAADAYADAAAARAAATAAAYAATAAADAYDAYDADAADAAARAGAAAYAAERTKQLNDFLSWKKGAKP